MTICIFGDSIVWGASDKKGGWVNSLKSSFMDFIHIYNLGVCGDTTDYLLERFKVECEAREPTKIVFAIGINDSSSDSGINIKKFENNLNELVKQAKEFTKDIVFIGLTRVDESKTQGDYMNDKISEYDSVLKKVAGESYVELFDLLEDADLEDGLHPNTKGHEKIFKRIQDSLSEDLK
jgi:lysophospholipase L1-like esterase